MVKAVVTELVLVQDHELTEEEKDELSFFEQVRQRKRQQEQQPQPVEVVNAAPPAAAPPASADVASAPPVAQPVPRAVAQPLTKMMVVIPPIISACMNLRIQTPHGLMEMTVPLTVGAGMPLEVDVHPPSKPSGGS